MSLIPRNYFFDDLFDDVKVRDMKSDIYEQDNNYIIEIDIPGSKKEDIDIDYDRGYINVSYESSSDIDSSEKTYIKRERVYSTTKRSFYVGDVSDDMISASFNDGVLKIVVPKKDEEESKRRIEVE